MFDYNLDFFEVGAIDDPAWKLENPKVRYVERALSAWPIRGVFDGSYELPPIIRTPNAARSTLL